MGINNAPNVSSTSSSSYYNSDPYGSKALSQNWNNFGNQQRQGFDSWKYGMDNGIKGMQQINQQTQQNTNMQQFYNMNNGY